MMGQYHLTCNLTKKEFICPHKLGMGLKLREQTGLRVGMGEALMLLLACSNGRGGGDFHSENEEIIGRWAGDQIAVVGDYAEEDDLPAEFAASSIYEQTDEPKSGWTDISDLILPVYEAEFGLKVTGTGWRNRVNTAGEDEKRLCPDI